MVPLLMNLEDLVRTSFSAQVEKRRARREKAVRDRTLARFRLCSGSAQPCTRTDNLSIRSRAVSTPDCTEIVSLVSSSQRLGPCLGSDILPLSLFSVLNVLDGASLGLTSYEQTGCAKRSPCVCEFGAVTADPPQSERYPCVFKKSRLVP